MSEKQPETKRMLTPEMFEVGKNGEIIIKDQEMIEMMKSAKKGEEVGEQGYGVGVIVTM